MRLSVVADSGPTIGLGHVGRCMGLAQGIEKRCGLKAVFYTPDPGAHQWIRDRGFPAQAGKPDSSDILIADSYRLTPKAFHQLRQSTRRLLVMDDLGHPYSEADWILNIAPFAERFPYPKRLLPRLLLGPRFYPFRREYSASRSRRIVRDNVRRVLITFGGGEGQALLKRILPDIQRLIPGSVCDVLIGPMSRSKMHDSTGLRIHSSPMNVRRLFEHADMAISAGGQTLYELAFTGLPAVVIQAADNQERQIMAFTKAGTILSAGKHTAARFEDRFISWVRRLAGSKPLRQSMARAGQDLVDGRGAQRVAMKLTRGICP